MPVNRQEILIPARPPPILKLIVRERFRNINRRKRPDARQLVAEVAVSKPSHSGIWITASPLPSRHRYAIVDFLHKRSGKHTYWQARAGDRS
jgi:hypothetical protein